MSTLHSFLPDGSGMLERPRIDALFREAARRPLVAVTAGPGYGKTSAVCEFLRNMPSARAMWVRLSKFDSIPGHFWRNAVSAAKPGFPDLARRLDALGFPSDADKNEAFLRCLKELPDSGAPVFVVIDDYRSGKSAEIDGLLEQLAEYMPKYACLTLISRQEIDIGLSGLRSGGMYRITAHDLLFTPTEIQELFASRGYPISAGRAAEIGRFTDGWALPLQLMLQGYAQRGAKRHPRDYVNSHSQGNMNIHSRDYVNSHSQGCSYSHSQAYLQGCPRGCPQSPPQGNLAGHGGIGADGSISFGNGSYPGIGVGFGGGGNGPGGGAYPGVGSGGGAYPGIDPGVGSGGARLGSGDVAGGTGGFGGGAYSGIDPGGGSGGARLGSGDVAGGTGGFGGGAYSGIDPDGSPGGAGDCLMPVASLFEKEYYAHYGADVRRLLAQLSLIPKFTAGVAGSIARDPAKALAAIRANPFVFFDGMSGLFTFQGMYRAFLAEKLPSSGCGETNRLLRAAGFMFFGLGHIEAAADSFLRCEAFDLALECMSKYLSAHAGFSPDLADYFEEKLELLPKAYCAQTPLVDYIRAMIELNRLNIALAYEKLRALEARVLAIPPEERGRCGRRDGRCDARAGVGAGSGGQAGGCGSSGDVGAGGEADVGDGEGAGGSGGQAGGCGAAAMCPSALLGNIYYALGFIGIMQNKDSYPEHFEKAAALLPDGFPAKAPLKLYIGFNSIMKLCGSAPGALRRMERAAHGAAPYFTRLSNGEGTGYDSLFSAEVGYNTFDFRAARQYAYRAVFDAMEAKQRDIVCGARMILAKTSIIQGDFEELRAHVDFIRAYAATPQERGDRDRARCGVLPARLGGLPHEPGGGHLPEYGGHLPEYGGDYPAGDRPNPVGDLGEYAANWMRVKMGDLAPLSLWAAKHGAGQFSEPPIMRGWDRVLFANYLMYAERFDELLAALDSLEGFCRRLGLWLGSLDVHIMRAIGYWRIREDKRSLRALRQAYDMSYANNIITPFVEAGSFMRTLIDNARRQTDVFFDSEWADNIYRKSSTYAKKLSAMSKEYFCRKRRPRPIEAMAPGAAAATRGGISPAPAAAAAPMASAAPTAAALAAASATSASAAGIGRRPCAGIGAGPAAAAVAGAGFKTYMASSARPGAGMRAARCAESRLSKRETEILKNLSQGLTQKDIADANNISVNTAKSAITNVYNKLGAVNKADAVRIAASLGILD